MRVLHPIGLVVLAVAGVAAVRAAAPPGADTAPRRYDVTKRASEIDPRACYALIVRRGDKLGL
jgi:hypothetical protein